MSLTLDTIYHSTGNKYHLKLIAGKGGLGKIMNWVYISEDISNGSFLRGGELVITTGVSASSKEWLHDFIKTMISHNTSGIIINTGKYIQTEDIGEDILTLCNTNDFCLFTMPWNIHIYDITRDYYNRIFLDTQTDTTLSNAFLSMIRDDSDKEKSLLLLKETGILPDSQCCICNIDLSTFPDKSRVSFVVESFLLTQHADCHPVPVGHSLLLIFYSRDTEDMPDIPNILDIPDITGKLASRLDACFPESRYTIGISGASQPLTELKDTYRQSSAAVTMAKYTRNKLYFYDDMGFFRLLLAVKNNSLLESYAEEYLGSLIEYDRTHDSSYTETLRQYLLCDGSIQMIASHLFCHRNTINYRVKTLRENWDLNLDDPELRFQLMTSFLILDYLKLKL